MIGPMTWLEYQMPMRAHKANIWATIMNPRVHHQESSVRLRVWYYCGRRMIECRKNIESAALFRCPATSEMIELSWVIRKVTWRWMKWVGLISPRPWVLMFLMFSLSFTWSGVGLLKTGFLACDVRKDGWGPVSLVSADVGVRICVPMHVPYF